MGKTENVLKVGKSIRKTNRTTMEGRACLAPNAVKIETSGREPLVLRRLVFVSAQDFSR